MKIKPEHYSILRDAIHKAAYAVDMEAYLAEVQSDPRVKDAHKRMRWDLLHASTLSSNWIVDNLYQYADDSHIDTALKAAMKELRG